jgi:hypothetical protein
MPNQKGEEIDRSSALRTIVVNQTTRGEVFAPVAFRREKTHVPA